MEGVRAGEGRGPERQPEMARLPALVPSPSRPEPRFTPQLTRGSLSARKTSTNGDAGLRPEPRGRTIGLVFGDGAAPSPTSLPHLSPGQGGGVGQ